MSNRKSPSTFDYAPHLPPNYTLVKVLKTEEENRTYPEAKENETTPAILHKATLLLHDANGKQFILKLSKPDMLPQVSDKKQQPNLITRARPEALAFFERANIEVTDTTHASLIPHLGNDITRDFFEPTSRKNWRTDLSTLGRFHLFNRILTSLHDHYYHHGIPHGNIRPENLIVRDDRSILLIDPNHYTTEHVEDILAAPANQLSESPQQRALYKLAHTDETNAELIRKIKVFARDFESLLTLFPTNDRQNMLLYNLCEPYLSFEIDLAAEKSNIVENPQEKWTEADYHTWFSHYYSKETLNRFINNFNQLHQAVCLAPLNPSNDFNLPKASITPHYLTTSCYQAHTLKQLISIFTHIKNHHTILSKERGFFRLFGSTGRTQSYQQALRTIKQVMIQKLISLPENTHTPGAVGDNHHTATELLQQHTSRIGCILSWLGYQTTSYKELQTQTQTAVSQALRG